jgi:phenylpropionate dioxygenase-like ring-hydroxylating dioxygenase large terminal subunit
MMGEKIMGLGKLLAKPLSGYPGGYKTMRRGSQGVDQTPPFQLPNDPKDRRSRIPPTGYREYWYPALPAKDVKRNKPSVLRMLGTDVVFFRDKNGEVQALLDWCPHRAVYLSMGRCYYKGYLTCPYHGATFDGDGNCVAFLTEGPDSKMVGAPGMKARKFPTVTIKGLVFVWMGEGEPVPPEEDIPPEMFEEHNIHRPSFTMFDCNWVLVLENTMDAHNAFMVHRNSIRILKSRLGGRPRTPLGYRINIVNNKTVHYRPGSGKSSVEKYYYDEEGNIPYQMYYPGVNGVWPLHRWRLLWTWFFDWRARRQGQDPGRQRPPQADYPDVTEWNGTRLPGMSRTGGNNRYFRSTRWAVPVEENLTRMVYLNVERYSRPPSLLRRFWSSVTWPYRNWELNFNFRNQDYDAEKYVQYSFPEYLSSTDSVVVAMRRLFVEHARDVQRRREREEELPESMEETLAEQMVREGDARVAETSKAFDARRLHDELLRRI